MSESFLRVWLLTKTRAEQSVLLWTALERKDNIAARMLINAGVDIDSRDVEGNTLMHKAAQEAGGKHLKMLYNLGAQVDAQNHNKETPLFFSVHRKDVQATETLLRFGANPNITDADNHTPLYYAKQHQHVNKALVDLLTEYGARRAQSVAKQPIMQKPASRERED